MGEENTVDIMAGTVSVPSRISFHFLASFKIRSLEEEGRYTDKILLNSEGRK